MDPNIKIKWVAALRSGEYEQAKGGLRVDTDGRMAFCCLGVLCDVQGRSWDGVYENVTSYVPPEFYAGLTERQQEDLAARNDGVGTHFDNAHSFEQIADIIDTYL